MYVSKNNTRLGLVTTCHVFSCFGLDGFKFLRRQYFKDFFANQTSILSFLGGSNIWVGPKPSPRGIKPDFSQLRCGPGYTSSGLTSGGLIYIYIYI